MIKEIKQLTRYSNFQKLSDFKWHNSYIICDSIHVVALSKTDSLTEDGQCMGLQWTKLEIIHFCVVSTKVYSERSSPKF